MLSNHFKNWSTHSFSNICQSLIIEFIPKCDLMVQKLLASREDIFPGYTQVLFEKEFQKFFNIIKTGKISNSDRTLYLMQNKNHA